MITTNYLASKTLPSKLSSKNYLVLKIRSRLRWDTLNFAFNYLDQ